MPLRRFNRPHERLRRLYRLPRRKLLRYGAIALGAFFLIGATTVLWWSKDLPDPQTIDARRISESTKIFDATGSHLLYEIGDIHRTRVPLSQVSPHLVKSTLTAEDDQFYEHHGLDFQGILRAVLVNIRGGSLQGGSTITQQLIKNSILTPERTLQRKVKEAVLALELEQRFNKDQILEMYLNDIPYGSQAYGVEAASQQFFGKSARDVNLSQAATLAALPKAPSYYSPHGSHFEDLKARQEHILNRMVELNFISRDEADKAKNEPLEFAPPRESIRAPHFVFYIKELLENQYGQRVVEQGGLKVTTTLDMRLQTIAEETLKTHQDRLKKLGASNAAMVALDPKSGDVLSMVGSIDYFNEEIDGNVNVAVRHRSPGSSIKPFVYAAAFQRGYTPDTVLVDAETDFGKGYRPKNYNLREHGPVTMRQALANSLNIPAVQTLYLADVRRATDLAQKMGMASLNDPDRYGLSLVLGGGEVRLIDEVSAYGVFANEGVRFPHRAVLKVESTSGEVLFDAEKEERTPEEVLSPQIARQVTNILSDNGARAMIFGGGSPLQLGSRPVAAKTGTAQEFRDGWTMGFTPSLVAGVWVGNNDNSPMGSRSDGVVVAGPIWNAFMREALKGSPIEQFTSPAPLRDIPHGALRNQLPEVKGKWASETNTLYSLECPVALGQERTIKELHSILYYVRRTNPLGPPPAHAEADPQFNQWEGAVAAWRDKHNAENKDKPEEPLYVPSLPEAVCNVSSEGEIPQVKIVEPDTTIITESPVTIEVEVESEHELREVRFVVEGQEIARRGKDDDFVAAFSYPDGFSGRMTLVVQAITENNLIGLAHRTFIINPDDAPPSVILHTPQNGTTLRDSNFPYVLKATATDASGIDVVDFLYRKEGDSSTRRVGRTTTLAPTAPNRYEVTWDDAPGKGTYEIYAVAYDKTGNFTESARHTVTIE
ncbi:MAG: PBP1A family penicillin-binding protein [Patescibacteria group bacterium]